MVTFGDDAFDTFVRLAQQIPYGYAVALLDEGEEPPAGVDVVPGVDVVFVLADHDGVMYRELDSEGRVVNPNGEPLLREWTQVARIHVY